MVTFSQSTATQVFSKSCQQLVHVLHKPLWPWSHIVVCLSRPFFWSRPFHSCHQSLYCWFSIRHRDRPLQTPRVQTLDDDLDWCFRKSFLRDCGRLYRSRLFSPSVEHHQHFFNKSQKCVVQPNSWCHDFFLHSLPVTLPRVLDQSHRKYTNCEMEGAPVCASDAPPVAA